MQIQSGRMVHLSFSHIQNYLCRPHPVRDLKLLRKYSFSHRMGSGQIFLSQSGQLIVRKKLLNPRPP